MTRLNGVLGILTAPFVWYVLVFPGDYGEFIQWMAWTGVTVWAVYFVLIGVLQVATGQTYAEFVKSSIRS